MGLFKMTHRLGNDEKEVLSDLRVYAREIYKLLHRNKLSVNITISLEKDEKDLDKKQ